MRVRWRVIGGVLLLAILVFGVVGWAANYYVTTAGNDGNDGSTGSPWLTVQHAVDTVPVSSTINVAAGTYHEAYSADCALKIDKSITLIGTGLPTVAGGARGKVVQVTADNVTISGMRFVNANAGIGIYLYGVGVSYTCENATIESCDVSNNNIGLYLAGANGTTIDGNTLTGNSYRSIVIQQDSDDNVVRDNTITMTGTATLDGIYIGSDSGGNTIGVNGEPNAITMSTSTSEGGGWISSTAWHLSVRSGRKQQYYPLQHNRWFRERYPD